MLCCGLSVSSVVGCDVSHGWWNFDPPRVAPNPTFTFPCYEEDHIHSYLFLDKEDTIHLCLPFSYAYPIRTRMGTVEENPACWGKMACGLNIWDLLFLESVRPHSYMSIVWIFDLRPNGFVTRNVRRPRIRISTWMHIYMYASCLAGTGCSL